MSKMEEFLQAGEKVIWNERPGKTAFLLPAFGGIPFALVFAAFAVVMLSLGESLFGFPLVLLIVATVLIVVPPIWQLKKFPNTEYMITNRRLLIKTGITERDIWSSDLDRIKEIFVKIGISDKILGTGKIYPITPEYPYAPQLRSYTGARRGSGQLPMNKLKKVHNLATGKDEEVTEWELYTKTLSHPHLEALKKPYEVQRIFKETIQRTEFEQQSERTGSIVHSDFH